MILVAAVLIVGPAVCGAHRVGRAVGLRRAPGDQRPSRAMDELEGVWMMVCRVDAVGAVRVGEPTEEVRGRPRRPVLPEADPFYQPPNDFEWAAAGAVLRSRAVEVALFGVVAQRFPAWQLLYRSCDLQGAAQAAVTTVLLPAGADPAVPRPLLSYQCAIDAVASTCFPSYALQRGAQALGCVPQLELLLIASALARGWAVSLPDHEGLAGNWGAPREPGYRALDGIRAALTFAPLGLNPSTPVGLWGYSGGGLATSWAAEMAPKYAPEINVVGAALGSPVGDPGSAFLRLNATRYAGLPIMVVAGLRHVYPQLDRVIRRHVSAEGREILQSVEHLSTIAAVRRLSHYDVGDHLDVPLADFLALPEVTALFQEIQPGGHAPSAPILAVQSVHDQLIAVDDVDGQIARYRAAGAHVTYRRDRLSEHIALHPLAAPLTLTWLADRFAGKSPPEPGAKTVWSTALSGSALRGLLGLTWVAAKVVMGRPV